MAEHDYGVVGLVHGVSLEVHEVFSDGGGFFVDHHVRSEFVDEEFFILGFYKVAQAELLEIIHGTLRSIKSPLHNCSSFSDFWILFRLFDLLINRDLGLEVKPDHQLYVFKHSIMLLLHAPDPEFIFVHILGFRIFWGHGEDLPLLEGTHHFFRDRYFALQILVRHQVSRGLDAPVLENFGASVFLCVCCGLS